jgi:hypothetical protein
VNTGRSTPLMVGIILLVLYSLLSIIASFAIPAPPPGEEGPPEFIIYLGIALGVVGLIAAFGLWQGKRWGLVVAVVVLALNALSALPGVVFAPDMTLQILATIGVVGGIVIIVLLLLPGSRRALV